MSDATHDRSGQLRWLVVFVASAIFTELVFYSSLGPLLPGLTRRLGLSSSEAGLLVAMYPIGTLLAVPPVVWMCRRIGVKATTALGLALIGMFGVLFAVVTSYEMLLATRFFQGAGAAGAWCAALAWLIETVPRARRGSLLGLALGVAGAGTVVGPALGALASATGRGPGFITLSALTAALGLVGLRLQAPARLPKAWGLGVALRNRAILTAVLLSSTTAVLMGAMLTLGPLRLDDLGVGSAAIGLAFSVAAAGSIVTRPLTGRWSDHHGRRPPIRIGLLGSALSFVALAVVDAGWLAALVVVIAMTTAGLGAIPGVALVADACDRAGVALVVAVAMMNLAFQPGLIVGSVGVGTVAAVIGVQAAFVVLAVISIAAAVSMLGVDDNCAFGEPREAPTCL